MRPAPVKRRAVSGHVTKTGGSIHASTVLAAVTMVGFIGFVVIDFMQYPWPEFTAWAILAVVALALSSINLIRFRSARYLGEVAVELLVLVAFQGRLLHLFAHAR